MVPNPNDADRKLDFFVNIAVVQMLALLQTVACMAGLTGDDFIVFFTRVITRMNSSIASPIVTSTPVNVDSAEFSCDATSSHYRSPQSGDRIGFSSSESSSVPSINTSVSLSPSAVAASPAPVAVTTVLEPQITRFADIASESPSTIIASSNDIAGPEPDVTPADSPRIPTEITPAATSSSTAFSFLVTPTDDCPLYLTSAVSSNTTRRRTHPLRREGACIFQNVSGQVVPIPLPFPVAPNIVSYASAPVFFPPTFTTTAPPPAFAPVTPATIPVSDSASHFLAHNIPVPGSPASSALSKRSWDEVEFDDDENETVEFSFTCCSASPPKRRRS